MHNLPGGFRVYHQDIFVSAAPFVLARFPGEGFHRQLISGAAEDAKAYAGTANPPPIILVHKLNLHRGQRQ